MDLMYCNEEIVRSTFSEQLPMRIKKIIAGYFFMHFDALP
jgi:hypothetical protein